MTKLKVGDRVRIRNGHRVFQVIEVDPVGSGSPAPPAKYLVRIKLPARTLINLPDLRSSLCAHDVTWVVLTGTPRDELAGFPELAHTRTTRLLKVDLRPAAARAALCGQTPTSG